VDQAVVNIWPYLSAPTVARQETSRCKAACVCPRWDPYREGRDGAGRSATSRSDASAISGSLGYTVEIERFETKVAGSDELTPVSLRVTSIFRLEGDTWWLLHRHADPITTLQSGESVTRTSTPPAPQQEPRDPHAPATGRRSAPVLTNDPWNPWRLLERRRGERRPRRLGPPCSVHQPALGNRAGHLARLLAIPGAVLELAMTPDRVARERRFDARFLHVFAAFSRPCSAVSAGRWDRRRRRSRRRFHLTVATGRIPPRAQPSAPRTPTPAPRRCVHGE
jgi:hypothetical protein